MRVVFANMPSDRPCRSAGQARGQSSGAQYPVQYGVDGNISAVSVEASHGSCRRYGPRWGFFFLWLAHYHSAFFPLLWPLHSMLLISYMNLSFLVSRCPPSIAETRIFLPSTASRPVSLLFLNPCLGTERMRSGNMGFLNKTWILAPPGSSTISYWFLSIRSGRRNMSSRGP